MNLSSSSIQIQSKHKAIGMLHIVIQTKWIIKYQCSKGESEVKGETVPETLETANFSHDSITTVRNYYSFYKQNK